MRKANQQIAANFAKIRAAIELAFPKVLKAIGEEAVNYSGEAFNKQGWEGESWKPRKSKRDQGRSILIGPGTGNLRRSIKVIRSTATSVTVGTNVPYASVHNYGLTINRKPRIENFVRNRIDSGKKRGRFAKGTTPGDGYSFKAYRYKMPQRQFIGYTPELRRRVRQVAADEMNKQLKHFLYK